MTEMSTNGELPYNFMATSFLGIRIIDRRKRVGGALTSIPTKIPLSTLLDSAVKSSRLSDVHLDALSAKKPAISIPGLYDEQITRLLRFNALHKFVKGISSKIMNLSDGKPLSSMHLTVSLREFRIMNSLGICERDYGTCITIDIHMDDRLGSRVFSVTRSLKDIKLQSWITEIQEKECCLGSRIKGLSSVDNVTCDIILSPAALTNVLDCISSDFVLAYAGYPKDRASVCSSLLSITDDGSAPGLMNSSRIDHEGYPRQRTKIVEKGTLENLVCDCTTATKFGMASTGNANRRISQSLSGNTIMYTPFPFVTCSNLLVESRSSERLSALLETGKILVEMAFPMFPFQHLLVRKAFGLQRGTFAERLRPFIICDSPLGLMRKIASTSNTVRHMLGRKMAAMSPYVVVRNCEIRRI